MKFHKGANISVFTAVFRVHMSQSIRHLVLRDMTSGIVVLYRSDDLLPINQQCQSTEERTAKPRDEKSSNYWWWFIYGLLKLLLLHPFNVLSSRTTWVSRHQKGKPFWIFLEQEMIGWQWHQLDFWNHMGFRNKTLNNITCVILQQLYSVTLSTGLATSGKLVLHCPLVLLQCSLWKHFHKMH